MSKNCCDDCIALLGKYATTPQFGCHKCHEIEQEQNYKMSAELEWYKRFHDYVKTNQLDEIDYKKICNFLFSEDDR